MKLSNSFFWIGQSLYSPIYYVMIYKIIYVNNLNKSHNSLKKQKLKLYVDGLFNYYIVS